MHNDSDYFDMMKREAEKTDEIGHFFLLVLFCKVKTFRAIRSTDLTRQNSTFLDHLLSIIWHNCFIGMEQVFQGDETTVSLLFIFSFGVL